MAPHIPRMAKVLRRPLGEAAADPGASFELAMPGELAPPVLSDEMASAKVVGHFPIKFHKRSSAARLLIKVLRPTGRRSTAPGADAANGGAAAHLPARPGQSAEDLGAAGGAGGMVAIPRSRSVEDGSASTRMRASIWRKQGSGSAQWASSDCDDRRSNRCSSDREAGEDVVFREDSVASATRPRRRAVTDGVLPRPVDDDDLQGEDDYDSGTPVVDGSDAAAAGGDCSAASGAGFRRRAARFPRGAGQHAWSCVEPGFFEVRGATYLQDRKKVPAPCAMFDFAHLDFVLIGAGGPVLDVAAHPDFCPVAMRREGDERFLLVVNWVLPPYQCVMVGAADPGAEWLRRRQDGDESPQARLWRRFLAMQPEEQKDVVKMIFSLEEGPWIVKKSVPRKPAIIGRQLKMDFRHIPGRHLEIIIDVSSGKSEQVLTGMVMSTMKSLKATLGLLIEARREDELPEALLFSPTLRGLDTSRLIAAEGAPASV